MQEVIDKLKELIEMLEEPEYRKYEDYWLTHVPEKHRKFAAYWDELGRPELEANCKNMTGWMAVIPDWSENLEYRIKDDQHWELRLKWVNSDKTLLIEFYDKNDNKWKKTESPAFHDTSEYREAKPWYEQEISNEKPMILKDKCNYIILWTDLPKYPDDWTPLTDQEIDALKRGF